MFVETSQLARPLKYKKERKIQKKEKKMREFKVWCKRW